MRKNKEEIVDRFEHGTSLQTSMEMLWWGMRQFSLYTSAVAMLRLLYIFPQNQDKMIWRRRKNKNQEVNYSQCCCWPWPDVGNSGSEPELWYIAIYIPLLLNNASYTLHCSYCTYTSFLCCLYTHDWGRFWDSVFIV